MIIKKGLGQESVLEIGRTRQECKPRWCVPVNYYVRYVQGQTRQCGPAINTGKYFTVPHSLLRVLYPQVETWSSSLL